MESAIIKKIISVEGTRNVCYQYDHVILDMSRVYIIMYVILITE